MSFHVLAFNSHWQTALVQSYSYILLHALYTCFCPSADKAAEILAMKSSFRDDDWSGVDVNVEPCSAAGLLSSQSLVRTSAEQAQ